MNDSTRLISNPVCLDMLSHYELRPLEIDDFNSFLEIQGDALLNSPEVFGSDYNWFEHLSLLSKELRFTKYMNYPYQFLLGAVRDTGQIDGMVGFSCDFTQSKLRHKGKIWGAYVRPESRFKGIGTKLIESVIETAQNTVDCELIHLSVSTSNSDSYNLYLRMGFTVYGTELRALKVGDEYVDEYLMVKFLR